VVHFTVSLLLSALLCVPWPGLGLFRATLGTLSVGALAYSVIVMQRARQSQGYVPVFEDWLWHVLLPLAAYGAVLVAAAELGAGAAWPMFLIAVSTLLLVCVGIHNAWDTVTYLTIAALQAGTDPERARNAAKPQPTRARGRRRR
jgi:hypothetical protein